MSNYLYIQYFLAQFLILFTGYNMVNRILIGYLTALFSIALLIPILVRFAPGYIYNIIFIILILNLIFFFTKKKYLEMFAEFKSSKKKILFFLLLNIFFIILFKEFHYKNFVYEGHDIVYWSPSIELFLSDYVGNVKNLTYYPAGLTAHPLYPTSVLSTASILVKDLNLISLLEVRYLLICTILTIACYFFYEANKKYTKFEYSFFFILFILLFYTFENYVAYSLIYSGIFVALIFILLLTNFENTDKISIKFNSYLSLFLIVTKPGIMFIFIVFPIYYFFKFKEVRKDILFYVLSLLVFLNMLTWIMVEKPVANFSLSLFNPLQLSDYYQTLLLSGSTPLGAFFENFEILSNTNYILNFEKSDTSLKNVIEAYMLQKDKINFSLFKFISIFTFFFVVPILLVIKNFKKNHVFIYFLVFSLIILVFLRNENIFGNKSVSQVVHIIYALPIFFIFIFLRSVIHNRKSTFNLIIFVCVFLLFSNFNINYAGKILSNRSDSPESVTYIQFLKEKNNYDISDKFLSKLNFKSIADVNKLELFALMLGKRINNTEYDKYNIEYRPVVMNWSIDRYHDFMWNNSVIKKNISERN
jgi:hypothetical protein